jgi:uncharacterized membrane protein (UPF0182 family)
MEKLLLVGLIAAVPMAIFGMIAKMTGGNKFLTFLAFKLPSIVVLVVAIAYFLKSFKLI